MVTALDPHARLLVTGASGKLGQLVLKHLLDTLLIHPTRIVAGSRTPDKLQQFAKRGVLTRRLDFDDPLSVEAAAEGVDRALLISTNDLFNRLVGHKAAITALVKAGVKHILYTSLLTVESTIVHDDHAATEAFLQESSVLGYTLLRNGMYFENTIASANQSGQWLTTTKDAKIISIARDDVALANATALASDNYANQIYELAGAEALTMDEMAASVSKVLGKAIVVKQVSVKELALGMVGTIGLSKTVTTSFHLTDGTLMLSTDFKTLTGQDPMTYSVWVETNSAMLQAL